MDNKNEIKNMWDIRYANEEYAYGTEPNSFLKSILDKQNLSGNILLPAEGEGRNAVYAAKKGLIPFAFDTSVEGQKKAIKLAKQEQVKINYEVGDFFNLPLINKKFDVAALIYAHLHPDTLSVYHKKIIELLKPGGLIILEGFSKNHIDYRNANPEVGGPKKEELLFSKDSIKNDFKDLRMNLLEEVEIELNEGNFHKGRGKVIRFIGTKPSY